MEYSKNSAILQQVLSIAESPETVYYCHGSIHVQVILYPE